MKRLMQAVGGLILFGCVAAMAGSLPLMDTTISTNGAAITTNTSDRITGEIEGLFISIQSAASPTVSVYVASSTTGSGELAQNIYVKTNVTASAYVPLRVQCAGTTGSAISGQYSRIPLLRDVIKTWAHKYSTTNAVTLRLTLVTAE